MIAWIRHPPSTLRGLPPVAVWDDRLARVLPIVFAVSTGFQVTKYVVTPAWIGFDASLYTAAAREWLGGGDPWSVSAFGILYGAPPPTLLVFGPFAFLPDSIAAAIWVIGSFVLASLAIRALGFKWWWIAFWPIVDGCLVGNPDIAVLAALVLVGRRFEFLAPILKVYAIFPMLADRRWRSLSVAGLIIGASVILLPWESWWKNLPLVSDSIARVADSSSVAGDVPLTLIAVIALAMLGPRRAGWLVVPVLWPWTQPHYLATSLPVLTPTLAILWSVPDLPPQVMLGSVIISAIGLRFFPAVGAEHSARPAVEPDRVLQADTRTRTSAATDAAHAMEKR